METFGTPCINVTFRLRSFSINIWSLTLEEYEVEIRTQFTKQFYTTVVYEQSQIYLDQQVYL